QNWRLLRALTRKDIVPVDEEAIAERARAEVAEKVWKNLLELAQGGEPLPDALAQLAGLAEPGGAPKDSNSNA
ncbi:MAG: hypothetical protein V3S01_06580, partial [Dehalococcoidia bacterium]